jgi:exopolyphosphatase/pppGpp-phosphohydrolase
MDKESIEHIYAQLSPMGIENPKKIKGIEDCRLDVFIIAQMIIHKIMEKLETRKND